MSTKSLNYSKDYSLFRHHQHQQPMSERHVKKLMDSMRQTGFWQSKPLTVVRDGEKFTVVDGHHRLAAAKALCLGVYYVIEAPFMLDQIGPSNTTVRLWQNLSFAKMHADNGNPHYLELLGYVEKGIPLRHAASLLRGESAHSGNASATIREGKFVVKTRAAIDTIVSFIAEFSDLCPAVGSAIFIEALSILLFVEEFDVELLRSRIRSNPRQLVKCNNREQMLTQIDEVYNFRTRDKVALAFLAKRAMDSRNLGCKS